MPRSCLDADSVAGTRKTSFLAHVTTPPPRCRIRALPFRELEPWPSIEVAKSTSDGARDIIIRVGAHAVMDSPKNTTNIFRIAPSPLKLGPYDARGTGASGSGTRAEEYDITGV